MKDVTFFPVYATLWTVVVDVGRSLGYAIALHGSIARDLDLIAIPWTEDAASPDELVEAVCDRLGAVVDLGEHIENPSPKPHGRLAWVIPIGAGAYIDLSVTPRVTA